jgi:hypothetical protein
MVKPRKEPSPEQLDALRGLIQDWRQSRKVPGPMPGELWDAAVALAKEFGVCRIARALTLDYTTLRKRTEKTPAAGLVKPTFVQLPAALAPENVPSTNLGATIEISARDGSRMRIHLETGRGMEAVSIVAAFLDRRG